MTIWLYYTFCSSIPEVLDCNSRSDCRSDCRSGKLCTFIWQTYGTVRLSKTNLETFCEKIRKNIKGPVLKALRHLIPG